MNRKSVMELELAAWERVLEVNLTGTFLCTKHAARMMKSQGSGKIINISSVYGLVAPSKGLQVPYTASKHGVIGLTHVNAVELAPLGIQVNTIAPGYFITEMTAELSGTVFEQATIRRTPSGRAGNTGDLVGTCLYLASRASDHVTGVCIPVDGGYMASDGMDRGSPVSQAAAGSAKNSTSLTEPRPKRVEMTMTTEPFVRSTLNYTLDREGFKLNQCDILFTGFDDDSAVRGEFFKAVAEFVRARVGARRVHVFDYNIRAKTVANPTTLEVNQALLLKCYDSETDGRARFMPYSAFEDPTSSPDAPPRESIEVRTIAFF